MKRFEFMEKMSGIDQKFVSEAANYRPKSMKSLRVIAIAACLTMMLTTLTVWGLTLTINEPADESIEEPSEKVLSFKTYMNENPDFKLSEESLAKLYKELDAVIEEYDVIEFENNGYINHFVKSCKNLCKEGCNKECKPGCLGLFSDFEGEYTVNNDQDGNPRMEYSDFSVSTDEDADTLKYLMLLSYIAFDTSGAVTYGDYNYNFMTMARMPFYYLFVSYDYADYGYDTALDYLKAVRNDEAEMGDNSYRVYFSTTKMIYKSNASYSEREYLWQKVSGK